MQRKTAKAETTQPAKVRRPGLRASPMRLAAADDDTRTMNRVVRKRLYDDIVSGRLPAGMRLTLRELSKRYQTSSTPVRAALLELQTMGLLDGHPYRGAAVRLIDEQYLANVYDLRSAVMGMLMPSVVRYITNDDLEQLDRLELKFRAAVDKPDVGRVIETRRDFYLFIFRIARNPVALDVIDRSWAVIDILRLRYGVNSTGLKRSMAAHAQILRALSRRDADAALAAVLESNARTRDELVQLLRQDAVASGGEPSRTQ